MGAVAGKMHSVGPGHDHRDAYPALLGLGVSVGGLLPKGVPAGAVQQLLFDRIFLGMTEDSCSDLQGVPGRPNYTSHSRFLATYTVPENVSGATIQIFVCAADGETIKGSTSSGSTVRLIPLYNTDNAAEFPGPRISIK